MQRGAREKDSTPEGGAEGLGGKEGREKEREYQSGKSGSKKMVKWPI